MVYKREKNKKNPMIIEEMLLLKVLLLKIEIVTLAVFQNVLSHFRSTTEVDVNLAFVFSLYLFEHLNTTTKKYYTKN